MKYIFIIFSLVIPITIIAQNQLDDEYRNLIQKAVQEYRNNKFEESLHFFEKAFEVKSGKMFDYYNAACSASLSNNLKKANKYLQKSIELGYINKKHLVNDKDFDNLRKDKNWIIYLAKLDNKILEIESEFKILKILKPYELIPFKKGNLWGYLEKKSGNIAVKAQFIRVSMGGECLDITLVNGLRIKVSNEHRISILNRHQTYGMIENYWPECKYFSMKIDLKNPRGGFEVNERSRIVKISKIYDQYEEIEIEDDCHIELVKCSQAFKFNNEWRVFVSYNNAWKLIDEHGEKDNKWPEEYKHISQINEFKGDVEWFFFEDQEGNKGFINSNREIKFLNEIDSNIYSYLDIKPNVRIVEKGNKSGVLDLRTISWILKPINYKVNKVNYLYENICLYDTPFIKEEIKISEYLFLVSDEKGNQFYIDKNNNEYRAN